MPEIAETTPAAIGPGSYLTKDPVKPTEEKLSPERNRHNLQFGTNPRFKHDFSQSLQPGPGQYNDQNKWNKRTYNLKFLNFQANAFKNNVKREFGRSNSLQMGGQNLIGGNPYDHG